MEATAIRGLGDGPVHSELNGLLLAEQHISGIISKLLDKVWSRELDRILRSALFMSESHQQALTSTFDVRSFSGSASPSDDGAIPAAIESASRGSGKDLLLAELVAKAVRRKLRSYETVLNHGCFGTVTEQRMLGGALSDEVATDLFLQELSERFRHLPH